MGWVQPYGKGRVFYTALGHGREAWTNPGFQRLVVRGIYWAVGRDPKIRPRRKPSRVCKPAHLRMRSAFGVRHFLCRFESERSGGKGTAAMRSRASPVPDGGGMHGFCRERSAFALTAFRPLRWERKRRRNRRTP